MAPTVDNDGFEDVIRDSCDRIADEYARRLFHELDQKPLDRELLNRFANLTAHAGTAASAHPATVASALQFRAQLCDMGCGPGQIARYLHDRGCDAFGLDLSPKMIGTARRLNPGIPFRVGNLLALQLPDDSLAGIAAFYAIVNIPKSYLPLVFREMLRGAMDPNSKTA